MSIRRLCYGDNGNPHLRCIYQALRHKIMGYVVANLMNDVVGMYSVTSTRFYWEFVANPHARRFVLELLNWASDYDQMIFALDLIPTSWEIPFCVYEEMVDYRRTNAMRILRKDGRVRIERANERVGLMVFTYLQEVSPLDDVKEELRWILLDDIKEELRWILCDDGRFDLLRDRCTCFFCPKKYGCRERFDHHPITLALIHDDTDLLELLQECQPHIKNAIPEYKEKIRCSKKIKV